MKIKSPSELSTPRIMCARNRTMKRNSSGVTFFGLMLLPCFLVLAQLVFHNVVACADTPPRTNYETHEPLRTYNDAVYGFKFQFPSDWKVIAEKVPTGTGEIRVGLISPIGATCAATIVRLDWSAKREDFLREEDRKRNLAELLSGIIESVYADSDEQTGMSARSGGKQKKIISKEVSVQKTCLMAKIEAVKNITTKRGPIQFVSAGRHCVPFGKKVIINFVVNYPRGIGDENEFIHVLKSFALGSN